MLAALIMVFQAGLAGAGQVRMGNPDFLIENWLEGDGLPESSAYSVAQTPDGYIWVGTADGIFRYNGYAFVASGSATNNPILTGVIQYVYVGPSGRLWVSSELGLGIREKETWRTIRSPNMVARTIAEDSSGQVFMGTYDGQLFSILNDKIVPYKTPDGLAPSGVFCLSDTKDGGLWLANRGFVGRLTPQGWLRYGMPELVHNSLVACTAHDGGIWTYTPGKLTRFMADGRLQEFPAPSVDQPRVLLEDRSGVIWIASNTEGYIRLKPGGPVLGTVNDSNGLVHNSSWCALQDLEGNFWLGSSCGGLSQLRPRIFKTIGVENGLPDQIVHSVAEESPGNMIVATHGRGTARIHDGKVVWVRPKSANPRGNYAWSVLHDREGRTWTGTYEGGLLVEENGVEREFPLPASLGKTVNCLLEDHQGRIWVGTGNGFGIIENDQARIWGPNCPVTGTSVRAIAENPATGAIWLGTFDRGLYRLEKNQFLHWGRSNGLPGNRVSSVYVDHAGFLWCGIFGHGLICIHGGHIVSVQGFPASVAGSIIEDGLGWFWFDSDLGILRASTDQLHRAIQRPWPRADFVAFDNSDGLYSADCSEGFQPSVTLDDAGHLWFATISGVVTVDPSQIQINTNPPPMVIEHISYRDKSGAPHSLPPNAARPAVLRPGSFDLVFDFAALSYSVPEREHYRYRLAGLNDEWMPFLNHHTLTYPRLLPGNYQLQIKAGNNNSTNDLANDPGAVFSFRISPYFWQTLWFRILMWLGLACLGGLAVWQLTTAQLRRQIKNLEQQRALERERARLATVMEATSDLVAFADNTGKLLHLNPAGRKLLGLDGASDLTGLTIARMHPKWAAQLVTEEGIPTARLHGTWEGETVLMRRDGHEIPVTQTIMAHHGPMGGDSFLSTIARDISERKRAEQASERLQAQLLQAQKMESVGRLAGGIAHDFNNMLQVILGNADLALEESTAGSQLHLELLEIQKSATRSAELTSQLLAFARKQVIRPQELNLNQTVEGTSKMLQRLIGENIELVLHLGENLWPVRMDPSQVTQVLTNLAINARDAINGQGRLVIEVTNVVLSQHQALVDAEVVPGEFVLLSVRDNGQGMGPEVLDHLFEPFFTTKDIGKGTGLGLATVFGIVKQNRGLIQVDSTPGQGSTFRIYFPRSVANNMNSPTTAQVPKPTRGTETILIVEDEENILHLVVLTLRKHGYHVLAALTPEAALNQEAAHNGKIDLLITDIVMPGMNGKELKEKLAANQPRMKSLFMSGYTAEVIAQHGPLEAGLNFLQKPFTIQSFLEKVRRILDTP